jgi:hypothetical protein
MKVVPTAAAVSRIAAKMMCARVATISNDVLWFARDPKGAADWMHLMALLIASRTISDISLFDVTVFAVGCNLGCSLLSTKRVLCNVDHNLLATLRRSYCLSE